MTASRLRATVIGAWRTNNRITVRLVEGLPTALWDVAVPGSNRTIRAVAAHFHNSRCMWIKTLGRERWSAILSDLDRAALALTN